MSASWLLLDLDGPLCQLFGEGQAATATAAVRTVAGACADDGALHGRFLDEWRAVRRRCPDAKGLDAAIHSDLAEVETRLARTAPLRCEPATLALLSRHYRGVAIVSNNCEAAVRIILDRLEASASVFAIGRGPDPSCLKPDPALIHKGMELLGASPEDTLFVGDALADHEAAMRASTRFVFFDPCDGRPVPDDVSVILDLTELMNAEDR